MGVVFLITLIYIEADRFGPTMTIVTTPSVGMEFDSVDAA